MYTSDSLHYGLEVITAPSDEPVTTEEAIEQLREDADIAQSSLIDALITAARSWTEEYLQRALLETQYTMTLDSFGAKYSDEFLINMGGGQSTIFLPRSQVTSVDAIRYIDDAGATQTLATSRYRADTKSLVARITPAYSDAWPTTRCVTNAVEIDFTAGYGEAAADVPQPIRSAILMMVAHWYENRVPVVIGSTAQEIPMAVKHLLGPYRVRS